MLICFCFLLLFPLSLLVVAVAVLSVLLFCLLVVVGVVVVGVVVVWKVVVLYPPLLFSTCSKLSLSFADFARFCDFMYCNPHALHNLNLRQN